MFMREIELRGHIIDSLILPKVLDKILDMGGDYKILRFEIGKRKTDPSYAKILVIAKDENHLDKILCELKDLGAEISEIEEVELKPAERDMVLPDNFYSTTNHKTFIRFKGKWIEVENQKMDGVIVVYPEEMRAEVKTIRQVKKGDLIVVGHKGIRVIPPEKPREESLFEFMKSEASSEKPKITIIKKIAKEMYEIRERYRKSGKGGIVVVAGPAVIHTGARDALAKLIKMGYVQVLFSGNALATHDIEFDLFGTSLGVDIRTGKSVPGGHSHHLRAINEIMKAGSIKEAVEKGVVKSGIMYECVKNNVPYVLAGSIRDDGPLPDVITDVVEAQNKMREMLKGKEMVLMLSTMLHSIATGNLLPSWVKTVCVDISPAVVTKLMDRGSSQALGVVTDVGIFLIKLVEELEKLEGEYEGEGVVKERNRDNIKVKER
ncbi:LOR/SDH bifunctional protein [Methanocaldococcus villosus KIN24-T80]|uniref:Ornithine cyclodeaminase n=1 Tax=Methanocaldococcus villosus KIN24-T80 TaxID=1069083 RepID=N6VP92_9EURY|nr:TIGR00300 family protein [Methanocaldococcus villosus]ENN95690.1 LOR/SDH bifunctional protein [Methanocaldococcus villosus KIN24-T80]